MKAVLLTQHGGPEMLRYGDAPDPTAGPGEVVVDIHAASVNAADYKVRLGSGGSNIKTFPYILGRDFSGLVSAVGTGVTDLAVGDAVFGVCDQGIEGAYAEKIAIKAEIIAKKPDSLGHAEAAALALTSITTLWALEDTVIDLQLGITLRGAAFYRDDYVKIDGQWKIQHTGYERTFEEVQSRKDLAGLTLTFPPSPPQ